MIALFDNLSAMIIGGAVLAMVLFMQQQSQRLALERVAAYSAKSEAISFGEWLQEDLANVGAGMSVGTGAIDALVTAPGGNTEQFDFRRRLSPADPNVYTISYRLVVAGTMTVDETVVPVYEVERLVDGAPSGKSMPTIRVFSIEMLDGNGQVTSDRHAARQLRVRFVVVHRYSQAQDYLHENHWATTIPLRVM